MARWNCRLLKNCLAYQDAFHPAARFCFNDHLFFSDWVFHRRFFWREGLDIEYHVREKTPSSQVFAGRHNVKIFAILSAQNMRSLVFPFISEYDSTITKRLLFFSFLLVSVYYSCSALEDGYSQRLTSSCIPSLPCTPSWRFWWPRVRASLTL